MNVYTVGEHKYRAWSQMRCDTPARIEVVDHDPHTWNGEHTIYGPYFCPGWPVHEPKHRKDVEPQ